jgi:ATP-dependent helicase/nuclease subunit B
MPDLRIFVGWEEPAVTTVRRHLIPDRTSGVVDLESTLVVVPTREAGRRLREAMARHCHEAGGALLSARIVTPVWFFRPAPGVRVAGQALVRASWARALADLDPADYPELFPTPPRTRDTAWALSMAEMLQGVRDALADGGYSIGAVIERLGADMPEPGRWADMARLEAVYLARLRLTGLEDPVVAKLDVADNPPLPDGVARVVLAVVPDPSMLALRALSAIRDRLPVEILVAAPAVEEGAFDAWGRPLPPAWAERTIPLPDDSEDLLLAGSPADQARMVLETIDAMPGRFAREEIAVGVPDPEVTAPLTAEFGRIGIHAFDPSEQPFTLHRLYHLVDALCGLTGGSGIAPLAQFIRQPDVFDYARVRLNVDGSSLLTELDTFQNEHLPDSLQRLFDRMDGRGMDSSYPNLARITPWIRGLHDALRTGEEPGSRVVRRLLRELVGQRECDRSKPADREFLAALEAVDGVLHEMQDEVERLEGTDPRFLLSVLRERLSALSFAPERPDDALDLEGWLEIGWNPAPCLLLTGMNETFVPDTRFGDPFLPDSLRKRLGLRDDALRFARDAYWLTAMIESRRRGGRVVLVCGKRSARGDPLKPSRLLFRCPDDRLAERAKRLFAPVLSETPVEPFTLSFRLDPSPPSDAPPAAHHGVSRMSVTAFRDYLECPFTFYLRQVLRMEALDDLKVEPDEMDYGIVAHHAMRRLAEDPRLRASTDAAAVARFLAGQAEDWAVERYGRPAPVSVRFLLDSMSRQLEVAARRQVELVQEGWETIAAEQRIEARIGPMTVVATLDRVDWHAERKAFRVIDYKTARQPSSPAEAHLVRRREVPEAERYRATLVEGVEYCWKDLQLPLYAQLWADRSPSAGAPVMPCYFLLPGAPQETGLAEWEGFNAELLESAMACARAVMDRVAERRFWPPGSASRVRDRFEGLLDADPETAVDPSAFAVAVAGGKP